MKNTYKLIGAMLILSIAVLTSCEKDDPVIPNEEELITTVTYTLTPVGGGTIAIFKSQDLDGEGGNAPIITVDALAANTTYSGILKVENELESPADDITAEVEEEGLEHQFFFLIEGGADSQVTYVDTDTGGNPVGIETTFTTGDASTGTLTIVLRHEPKKPNDGTLADAGGETDVEVAFDFIIE